jgi:hypothetical protein
MPLRPRSADAVRRARVASAAAPHRACERSRDAGGGSAARDAAQRMQRVRWALGAASLRASHSSIVRALQSEKACDPQRRRSLAGSPARSCCQQPFALWRRFPARVGDDVTSWK